MLVKQYVVEVKEFDALYEEACYTKQFIFNSFKKACEFYAEDKYNEFYFKDHWYRVALPCPVWNWIPEEHKIHGNPAGNEFLAFYRKKSKEMDDFLDSLDDEPVDFKKAIQSVFGDVKDIAVSSCTSKEEYVFDRGDSVF